MKTTAIECNVILTFAKPGGRHLELQELFDLNLRVSAEDTNCLQFLDRALFAKIAEKCRSMNRQVEDLMKVSIATDWRLYEKVTQSTSLLSMGHPCKWYFAHDRHGDGLSGWWEQVLMEKYGFGQAVSIEADLNSDWIKQFISS